MLCQHFLFFLIGFLFLLGSFGTLVFLKNSRLSYLLEVFCTLHHTHICTGIVPLAQNQLQGMIVDPKERQMRGNFSHTPCFGVDLGQIG